MRALITGGAGFIGQHLAMRLLDQGERVLLFDNYETSLAGQEVVPANFCDISDRASFYREVNWFEPDLVIHCAASYKDPDAWHQDTATNVVGTINTINVARYHGAKLVYFQTALPPISSYANTKLCAEHFIRISGLDSLIFRLSNIYGPRNLSGPVPAFFKCLRDGTRCTVVPTVRDMVYIDDLVDCVMLALEKDRLGRFDICSGEALPILSLYRHVASHFPNAPEPEYAPIARDDVMPATSVHAWMNGWQPLTPIQEGIANAVDWYHDNGVGETYTHLKLNEGDQENEPRSRAS